MSDEPDDTAPKAPDGVDPEEFLRALLNISPEDAEKVRDDADTKADGKGKQRD